MVHKLLYRGAARTRCGRALAIPDTKPTDESYEDGQPGSCAVCDTPAASSPQVKRFAVFAIRQTKVGTVWIRAGVAFQNRDGTIGVELDVLPIDGKLQLRDPPVGEKEKV